MPLLTSPLNRNQAIRGAPAPSEEWEPEQHAQQLLLDRDLGREQARHAVAAAAAADAAAAEAAAEAPAASNGRARRRGL
jgi:hypothetical protein